MSIDMKYPDEIFQESKSEIKIGSYPGGDACVI